MNDSILLTEQKDGVMVITLNRPEVMNSFNWALLHAMEAKIAEIRFDPSIRVVIITGAGERAFCTGADLKERRSYTPMQVKEYVFTIRNLFTAVEQLNKPVITAINGIALGGGTELALASDIRIASQTASMGLTETRLAVIPGAGGTQRLPRLVGKGHAKEMIFTAKRINADEALSIGLVNRVCAAGTLLETCRQLAAKICENAPIAIEQAKYAINYGMETDLSTGLSIESNAYWVCIPTEDRLEGLAAFREKRNPVFKGQ
ncbi:EchA6: enoyl-CoA hydratase/isomerase [Desulfosarcina variabilis str. Montpellier]|uniref:enoyl-CoA hydratase-related protein n=1 Tax=Desulfosarcina variabilis TaxID=2300 RepID=UPI003AFB3556